MKNIKQKINKDYPWVVGFYFLFVYQFESADIPTNDSFLHVTIFNCKNYSKAKVSGGG